MKNLGRSDSILMKNLRRYYRYLTKTWNSRQVISLGESFIRSSYWSNILSY